MSFFQGGDCRFRLGKIMASQLEVAAHLNLSERQVRNLLSGGVLPASRARIGLDIDACRVAYIGYLRGMNSGQIKPELTPPGLDDVDPSLEIQLMEQRIRLTTAQAVAVEKKNQVEEQLLVPVDFAIFALSKVAAQLASMLDTLPLKLVRKHPDMDARHLESLTREIAIARNMTAEASARVPDELNEYFETMAE